MQRFAVPVAVVVMIARSKGGTRRILLQRRRNTGFGDGMWDFACSGHVERGESLTDACARECREELGIDAAPENFKFFTLVYKRDGSVTYVNPYFYLDEFSGEPERREPFKCSDLAWFDEEALPCDLLPDRRQALQAFGKGVTLIEYDAQKN